MKNYRFLFVFGFILLISFSVQAEQPPEQQWVRRYNGPGNYWDDPVALAVDDLGNVYVMGKSYGDGADFDYATIKYTQHDYCLGPIEGDLNDNCKVTFLDYAILAKAWLQSYYFEDLATVAEDWLKCNFALEEDCW